MQETQKVKLTNPLYQLIDFPDVNIFNDKTIVFYYDKSYGFNEGEV